MMGLGDWLLTPTSLGTSRLWVSTTRNLKFLGTFFPAEATAKLCWGLLGHFGPQGEESNDPEHHRDTEQWLPFTPLD